VGFDEARNSDDAMHATVQKPQKWRLRPQFSLWPTTHHHALLCMLAKFVMFRNSRQRGLTLHDFLDFMRRSKWKLYQLPSRSRRVGNYLTLLDTT